MVTQLEALIEKGWKFVGNAGFEDCRFLIKDERRIVYDLKQNKIICAYRVEADWIERPYGDER